MLGYEIRKNFFNRMTLLSVALLLLFNAVNIFKHHYPVEGQASDYVVYLDIYKELKGKDIETCKNVITEKLDSISELPQENVFLYSRVYEEISEELKEISRYKEISKELEQKSIQKAEMYQESSPCLYQLNQKISDSFAGREITAFRNVNKITELINYKFSYLLIIFLIIMGGAGIFSYEKERGTYCIIKATRKGHRRIAEIKIISMQLYVITLALLFGICNAICFKICYQFDGFEQPLYAIKEYRNLPVNVSIIVFLIKNFLFGLLGLSMVAVIVMFISAVFQNIKVVFGGSLVVIIGFIFYRAFVYLGAGKRINLLNPVHYLISEKMMLYFETVQIGSYVVACAFIGAVTMLGMILLLSAMVVFLYDKNLSAKSLLWNK